MQMENSSKRENLIRGVTRCFQSKSMKSTTTTAGCRGRGSRARTGSYDTVVQELGRFWERKQQFEIYCVVKVSTVDFEGLEEGERVIRRIPTPSRGRRSECNDRAERWYELECGSNVTIFSLALSEARLNVFFVASLHFEAHGPYGRFCRQDECPHYCGYGDVHPC